MQLVFTIPRGSGSWSRQGPDLLPNCANLAYNFLGEIFYAPHPASRREMRNPELDPEANPTLRELFGPRQRYSSPGPCTARHRISITLGSADPRSPPPDKACPETNGVVKASPLGSWDPETVIRTFLVPVAHRRSRGIPRHPAQRSRSIKGSSR